MGRVPEFLFLCRYPNPAEKWVSGIILGCKLHEDLLHFLPYFNDFIKEECNWRGLGLTQVLGPERVLFGLCSRGVISTRVIQ